MNKKKEPLNLGGLFSIGLMAGITGFLMAEMKKMFGENIPTGIVREIMQGVMDGLLTHFEMQIDDLKRDKKKLEDKVEELELKLETTEAALPKKKKKT